MTTQEALQILESMPKRDFQAFFKGLPERVQLCVRGGLVSWKEVLPEWYVKSVEDVSDPRATS